MGWQRKRFHIGVVYAIHKLSYFFLCFDLHVSFCIDLLQAIDEAAFSVAYANMCRCLIPVSNICLINLYLKNLQNCAVGFHLIHLM